MPIFEYQCHKCGQVTEKIQSKPIPEISCPNCSAPALRRVSRTAFTSAGSQCGTNGAGSGFT